MTEVTHIQFKPERVRGYLDDARAIVTELGLDDSLRGIAFAKAVDLLAGVHVVSGGAQAVLMPQGLPMAGH